MDADDPGGGGPCRAAAWADVDEKVCKRCERSLGAIMFAPKQWSKRVPCCSDCAFELRVLGDGDDRDEARGENAPEAADEDEGARCTRQLEYYFSPRNWAKDDFLRGLADDRGSVALGVRETLQLRFNMTLYESMRAIFVSRSRELVQR